MTYKELREEVTERGFGDFEQSSARLKRWVNQAYREVTDRYTWPFLRTSKEGTMPMTISDLAHVLAVTDKNNENVLFPADKREVNRLDTAVDETGTAVRWYRATETEIKVWPADTSSTFIVDYVKTPAELKEDTDEPLIPKAYQNMIVNGTVARAYENRDNMEAAEAVRRQWGRELAQMRSALLLPNYDGPRVLQRTGFGFDYL